MDILEIIKEELLFEKKKKKPKRDACYHKVKSRYDVWPSAYASAALVTCRKVGAENWGESKKESEEINRHNLILERKKKRKLTKKPSSETNLGDWFKRKGAKGSTGGWVDCNAPDGEGGYKPCGRKEGEKRSKYPACRPTKAACKDKGKGKSWGKKAKKESISEGLQYHIDHNIPLVENIYRWGSEGFFNLINETRELYKKGEIDLCLADRELLQTNMGEKSMFEGKEVWLEVPMVNKQVFSWDGTYANEIDEQGADTSWSKDEDKITLQDILELTEDIPIINFPTKELSSIVLNWDNNPDEIERISQVEISSQYPILIMVDENGKIQWILDGNHRAQKALRSNSETIPAKLIKPSNLNPKSKKIFGLSEDDKFKGKKSGSPTRDTSGGKAYKVYVAGCSKKTDSNPRGIKLIRFGSGGLKAKLSNPEAKKSFNARHGCSKGRHNDKCKAGYYSCRLPRYSKKLNLSGGGTWW